MNDRDNNKNKKTYRTRKQAAGVVSMPQKYAIITNAKYKDALSFLDNANAHLQTLPQDKDVSVKDGIIYVNGLPASTSDLNRADATDYSDYDLPLLRVLYSIILGASEGSLRKGTPLPQVITAYVPDILHFLGKEKISRNETISIVDNILRFHNVVGVIDGDILPVMVSICERQENNTLSFSSPLLK